MEKTYDCFRYAYRLLIESLYNNYPKKLYYYMKNKKQFKNHKKTVYIVTTPEYGNIGDHAIAEAEKIYLEAKFPEYLIQEIPDSRFDEVILSLIKNITSFDIICFIGGGNFGILYPNIEYNRRFLIRKCRKAKIYLFPQSSVWGCGWYEMAQLRRSSRIYSNNLNLVLMARDETTYELMKENFTNKVFLVPDIVLTTQYNPSFERDHNKVLICFRNDVEKITSTDLINTIQNYLIKLGYDIITLDTETYKQISGTERNTVLEETLTFFSKVGYVITDRLHGMIFSVITGTPCLALDNSTKKISGVKNKWIKSPNILLFNDKISIIDQIQQLLECVNYAYDAGYAKQYFDDIFADKLIDD